MAAITSAVIGAGVGLYGASKQAGAAKAGAKASQQATDATIAEQRRQYDLSRADQMPWLNAGKDAIGQQQALMSGDFSKFYQSPDYQFALDEGFKSMDRSAASRGRLYSGGYGQDLTKYGQGLATQNYNNFYSKLAGLSNTGSGTATNLGQLGQNFANSFGTAQMNNANNRASSYQGQANAWTGFAQGAGSAFGDWWGTRDKSMNGGWYLGNQPGKG